MKLSPNPLEFFWIRSDSFFFIFRSINKFPQKKILSIVFLIVIFFQDCSSVQIQKRELIDQTNDYAVYKMDKPRLLEKSSAISKNPTFSKKELEEILKSFYTESSIFGKNTVQVVENEIAEKLQETLSQYISKDEPETILQIVIKRDDKLSPSIRIFRTDFLFFQDEKGLNFIFSEVNQSINFGNLYSFTDWATPRPFEANSSLSFESTIQINKILQFGHRFENDLGQICDLEKKKELKCRKIVFSRKKIENQKIPYTEIEEKLKILKNLFEKKLINEKEYESKKLEILEKF